MEVDAVSRIAVVGAGLMGHGIALEFALAGYDVRLQSRSQKSLDAAASRIDESLNRLVDLGKVSRGQAGPVPAAIRMTTDLGEAAADADVAIESVYEDLELKRQIFRDLDALCPERTILTSNTSTLMPSTLASATQRLDKVLVTHYINPPVLVPLVEVARGEDTSDETLTTVTGLLKKVGKQPVVVAKEVIGFIASRLQGALLREALWLVENGVATAEDVDVTIKSSLGRRWAVAGVFEVLEIAGWDLVLLIDSILFPELASSPEVSPVMKEMVARGDLGLKSGKGFYDWTPESAEALRQRISEALVRIDQW